MEFVKKNILLIVILIMLLSTLLIGIFEIVLLNQIKDLTGVPYRIELMLEKISNTGRSIELELKSLYKYL
jgi:hypothetical protein